MYDRKKFRSAQNVTDVSFFCSAWRWWRSAGGEWSLKQNYPRYLVDEKAGKVNRSILDILYMNVYFTSTPSSTRVLDTGSVAHICKLKQELRNKRRLAKGEMTMCVGSVSKVDVIKHRMLPLPSRFGVCVEHDWIMFIAIRLFI